MELKQWDSSGIKTYSDLTKLQKYTFAVLTGSIEEKILLDLGINKKNIYYVPDALSGKTAVEMEWADCLFLSSPTVRSMMESDKRSRFVMVSLKNDMYPLFDKNGYGAFGFRKSDSAFISKWNDVMKEFIGSQEHLEIISKFAFTRDELPGKITSQMILENDE